MYRYEQGSAPDLRTAVQLAAIYRAPVESVFHRLCREARRQIGRKLQTLPGRERPEMSIAGGHIKPILAIDPWTKAIGVAVLSGEELWHCGVRHLRTTPLPDRLLVKGRTMVEELIRIYRPRMLVLPKMDYSRSKRSPHVQAFCRAVKEFAARTKLKVAEYPRNEVQQTMKVEGKFNRHHIAVAIAKRFPELASKLPPPRKFYKPQDLRVSAFYAVALALTVARRGKALSQER